jgi:hypothetical protein
MPVFMDNFRTRVTGQRESPAAEFEVHAVLSIAVLPSSGERNQRLQVLRGDLENLRSRVQSTWPEPHTCIGCSVWHPGLTWRQ